MPAEASFREHENPESTSDRPLRFVTLIRIATRAAGGWSRFFVNFAPSHLRTRGIGLAQAAAMKTNHPSWWTNDHSTSWEKVKEAFRRDWEQTKADLSKKAGHDLNQNIGDTVKQAAGKEAIPAKNMPNPSEANFDDFAPALELGHGARQQYGTAHKTWTPDLEKHLQKDWDSVGSNRGWSDVQDYVRKGFDGNGSL